MNGIGAIGGAKRSGGGNRGGIWGEQEESTHV